MDKMNGKRKENKTQILYRYSFSYSLSKLRVDNRLEDLWRRVPDSLQFHSLQVLWKGSRIDRVCSDIKIVNNAKINHIMVSFKDHYNVISIDRLSQTKTGKDSWYLDNFLLWKREFSSGAKTFLFHIKAQEITTLQQVSGGNTPNLFLKRMLRYFLKISLLKKILQFQDRICFFIKSEKK